MKKIIVICAVAMLSIATQANSCSDCGGDMGGGGSHTTSVPEPATMLLFGTGLIGLAVISRRKIKM